MDCDPPPLGGRRSQGDAVETTLRGEKRRLQLPLAAECCGRRIPAHDHLEHVSRLHYEGHRQTTVQVPGPDVVHLRDQNPARKPTPVLGEVKRSKSTWTRSGSVCPHLKETVKWPQARLVSGTVRADHVDKHTFLQKTIGHAEAEVPAVQILPDHHL